jgi:hypothetical protein
MYFEPVRGFLILVAGFALASSACTSGDNGLPPACNALFACCSSSSFDQSMAIGCEETAQSGSDTDAGCGEQLAEYQAQGRCPDGGPG